MGKPKSKKGLFTYADYLTWPDDERWELIDGVAWDMRSAPNRMHQTILLNLARLIADITDRGPCETYLAPFDVRLSEARESDESDDVVTVVQPDISVFCRQDVLDDHGATAAPEIAVEIMSPATCHKDQTEKLALYERHGVQEYWLVNGESGFVMIYRLQDNHRFAKPDYYHNDDSLVSQVLGGAEIPLASFVIAKTIN